MTIPKRTDTNYRNEGSAIFIVFERFSSVSSLDIDSISSFRLRDSECLLLNLLGHEVDCSKDLLLL